MDSILNQLQQTSWVEWLGTATGLVAVYLSIKEKVIAWPLFIICYSLYAYLSFTASLYSAMVLNICFIPISVYGWVQWSQRDKNTGVSANANANATHGSPDAGPQKTTSKSNSTSSLSISKLSFKQLSFALVIVGIGTLLLGTMMSKLTQGALPYLDAFATSLSFFAQWLLSRKYIENWIAWATADIAFIILWGIQGYWVAVSMFAIFTALSVSGFISWKKEFRGEY